MFVQFEIKRDIMEVLTHIKEICGNHGGFVQFKEHMFVQFRVDLVKDGVTCFDWFGWIL